MVPVLRMVQKATCCAIYTSFIDCCSNISRICSKVRSCMASGRGSWTSLKISKGWSESFFEWSFISWTSYGKLLVRIVSNKDTGSFPTMCPVNSLWLKVKVTTLVNVTSVLQYVSRIVVRWRSENWSDASSMLLCRADQSLNSVLNVSETTWRKSYLRARWTGLIDGHPEVLQLRWHLSVWETLRGKCLGPSGE